MKSTLFSKDISHSARITALNSRPGWSKSTRLYIASRDTNITGFSGELSIDVPNDQILLTDPKTQLSISMGAEAIISNVKLTTLVQEDSRFRAGPEIDIDSGTLEIKNFHPAES